MNNFWYKNNKKLPLLHLFLCEGIFCAMPPLFVKNEQFFTFCVKATRVLSAVPAHSCKTIYFTNEVCAAYMKVHHINSLIQV